MIEPGPDTLLDIVITGSLVAVTIRRAQRLYTPIPVLESEFGELICQVRELPRGGPVCRECWWYNRHGKLRFFRVHGTAIMELTADGTLLPAGTETTEKPAEQGAGLAAYPKAPPGEVPAGWSQVDHPE